MPGNNPEGRDSQDLDIEPLLRPPRPCLFTALVCVVLWVSGLPPVHEFDVTGHDMLYSPAQQVLDHEVVKFGNDGIFQSPPSDEVDKTWVDFRRIQDSEKPAARLPNKTYPTSGELSDYVVQLEVFHQLHCLNQIRKGLHPEYYNSTTRNTTIPFPTPAHLAHCVNLLRQSLTLVWQWNPAAKRAEIRFGIVHSCRNFDRITDWAKERHIETEPDFKKETEDDIVIPEF